MFSVFPQHKAELLLPPIKQFPTNQSWASNSIVVLLLAYLYVPTLGILKNLRFGLTCFSDLHGTCVRDENYETACTDEKE